MTFDLGDAAVRGLLGEWFRPTRSLQDGVAALFRQGGVAVAIDVEDRVC